MKPVTLQATQLPVRRPSREQISLPLSLALSPHPVVAKLPSTRAGLSGRVHVYENRAPHRSTPPCMDACRRLNPRELRREGRRLRYTVEAAHTLDWIEPKGPVLAEVPV